MLQPRGILPSRSRTRSLGGRILAGFTLIELLVVVAILAVIMSLLIPAVSRARQQAVAIHCQSNLRQIYGGFVMYAQAYDDRIPPYGYGLAPGYGWFRYMGREGYWGTPETPTSLGLPRWKLFRCAAETGSPWNGENVPYYDCKWYGTSYTMNFMVSWYESDYDPTVFPRPFRKGFLEGPERVSQTGYGPQHLAKDRSDAPLVMDIQDHGAGYAPYYFYEVDRVEFWPYYQGNTGFYYAYRHPNLTANVLYMDGHVEAPKHVLHGGAPIFRYLWTYPPSRRP